MLVFAVAVASWNDFFPHEFLTSNETGNEMEKIQDIILTRCTIFPNHEIMHALFISN